MSPAPAGGRLLPLGGLYEQQQIAFRGLLIVMIAASALVFLLLLFLYESFRVAPAIMLTTLLAHGGGLHRALDDRHELNISS